MSVITLLTDVNLTLLTGTNCRLETVLVLESKRRNFDFHLSICTFFTCIVFLSIHAV